MNNAVLAKVLYTNKLATRGQIEQHWSKLNQQNNIAQLLLEAGVINDAVYAQVLDFVQKMQAPTTQPPPPEPPPPVVTEEPVLEQLTPNATPATDVPTAESVTLAIEGNNPYGSMLGAGQVVPIIEGLESNKLSERSAAVELPTAPPQQGLPKRYTLFCGDGESEPPPRTLSGQSSLAQVIAFARQKQATDVYLQPETPILLRRGGHMLMASESTHSIHEVERWIGEMAAGHAEGIPPAKGYGACCAIGLPGLGRVRITVEWSKGKPLVSIHLVPQLSQSLKELGLPDFCHDWPTANGGLVFIAGAASSGRTTTLYAMGEQAAKHRSIHLQTLENPIERILTNPRGLLIQTEVGTHTPSVEQGIRAALEDAPDVFLFDGLQNGKELESILQLANAGSLVIATTAGNNTLSLLMRLFESCPTDKREHLRNQLSELLKGVICQHLIPTNDAQRVILAYEAFKVTPGISSMIRKNDLQQIPSAIAGLKNQGMALDDCLSHLLENQLIAGADAWAHALDPRRFQQHRPHNRKK